MSETEGKGRYVAGAILVALGAIFLAAQFLKVDESRYLWPLFIIGPGALFFVGMAAGGRSAGGLAIPGSIVTTIGLILFYQNAFDRWESWTYAWALIVAAVGIGLMIHGKWSGLEKDYQSGRHVAGIGLVLFLVFGSFFELIIGISDNRHGFSRIVWPLVLIGAGLYMVFSRMVHSGGQGGEPARIAADKAQAEAEHHGQPE